MNKEARQMLRDEIVAVLRRTGPTPLIDVTHAVEGAWGQKAVYSEIARMMELESPLIRRTGKVIRKINKCGAKVTSPIVEAVP